MKRRFPNRRESMSKQKSIQAFTTSVDNEIKTDACPLCGVSEDLDYHHWDYERNIGVCLCRECHNYIHGGDHGRVSIQQNRVEYYGGDHWHETAITQLIVRDLEFGGLRKTGITPGKYNSARAEGYEQWALKSWREYKDRIEELYNLPPDWTETADGTWFKSYPQQFTMALQYGWR
jgi:hypothetical protein